MSATIGVLVLIMLNVFDYTATIYSLQRGAVELNPLFNYLYHINTVYPLLLKLGVMFVIALMVSRKKQGRLVTGTIWFAVGIYGSGVLPCFLVDVDGS